jgi:hypothetical protein
MLRRLMRRLLFIPKSMAISLLCITLAGCGTFQKPTGYKYFPEYGWIPVIENKYSRNELYKSEMLVSYVAYDWQLREDGSTDTWTAQRPMLPATETEAKLIVSRNISISRNADTRELAKQIISAPLLAPALTLMSTPPLVWIIESSDYSKAIGEPYSNVTHNGKQEIPRNTSDATTVSSQGGLEIHVEDRFGRPVSQADIVVIYSPIWFTAYADEHLLRSYPYEEISYPYRVSIGLANQLAKYLGIEGAPSSEKTGADGSKFIALRRGIKAFAESSGEVHFLIHKAGYVPQAISMPAAKLISTHSFTITLEQESESPVLSKQQLNPWTVSQYLEQQVKYYLKKYDNDPAWKVRLDPPLNFERFREYTLAARSFAPDYPVVQSAMFFLELEKGNREEAKKHGRFIDNNIYSKAIYQMIWDGTSTVFKGY